MDAEEFRETELRVRVFGVLSKDSALATPLDSGGYDGESLHSTEEIEEEAKIIVRIRDQNDNAPQWKEKEYIFRVNENESKRFKISVNFILEFFIFVLFL